MRKILNVFIIVLMVTLLTGCNYIQKKETNLNKPLETETTDNSAEDKTDDKKEDIISTLECTKDNIYGVGDIRYDGTFTFKNASIIEYEYRLIIPKDKEINDYYTEEQISNSGRYELSLEDNVIIHKLTPDRTFWNDWKYKNKTLEEIKTDFETDDYKCVAK